MDTNNLIIAKNFLQDKTCWNCKSVHDCGIYYFEVRQKNIPAVNYTCIHWSNEYFIKKTNKLIK